jgi:tetratricopeptide (TPR) repeat protein
VYTDPRVVRFIDEHLVPVRIHVSDQPDEFKRLGAKYGALWTPTVLVIDSAGDERHRIEGFLPVDDFLAQLTLGLGHAAFARSDFAEAERLFREVVEQYPATEAAPEALYWAGVARYKATGDPASLRETAQQFRLRYQQTSWAKKASVWS